MRVITNEEACVAAGQCVLAAAGVFDQRDDDGVVILLDSKPPAEAGEAVRQAALLCPAQAIQVIE